MHAAIYIVPKASFFYQYITKIPKLVGDLKLLTGTVYTCIIIIQGVKLVIGTKLLAPAKLIFNTPANTVVR